MPERPPSNVSRDSREWSSRYRHATLCKSRTDSVCMHLYTLTDSGLVQFGNARSISCGQVLSGKDDVMMEVLLVSSFGWFDFD